ncbi:MAG: DUF2188 domain-containing protein [Mycoplasmoidaceae bacterium]
MLFWKKKKNIETSNENNDTQETERKETKIDATINNSNEDYSTQEVNSQKSNATKKTPAKKGSSAKKKPTKKSPAKKTSSAKKKPAKKTSSTKKASSSKSASTNRNIYHVSPRKDKAGKKIGWEIKLEGSKKVTSFCKTKDEAISKVKSFASNKGATIMIKKIDGSHQETIKL